MDHYGKIKYTGNRTQKAQPQSSLEGMETNANVTEGHKFQALVARKLTLKC